MHPLWPLIILFVAPGVSRMLADGGVCLAWRLLFSSHSLCKARHSHSSAVAHLTDAFSICAETRLGDAPLNTLINKTPGLIFGAMLYLFNLIGCTLVPLEIIRVFFDVTRFRNSSLITVADRLLFQIC